MIRKQGKSDEGRDETTKCAGSASDDDCGDPFSLHNREENNHRINLRREKNVKTFTFLLHLRFAFDLILNLILVYASLLGIHVIVPMLGKHHKNSLLFLLTRMLEEKFPFVLSGFGLGVKKFQLNLGSFFLHSKEGRIFTFLRSSKKFYQEQTFKTSKGFETSFKVSSIK